LFFLSLRLGSKAKIKNIISALPSHLPRQMEVSLVQTKEFAQTFLFAQTKAPSLGGVSRCSRDGVGLKEK